MANWKNALASKNYTPENLGAAGQNGIKQYNEVFNETQELKQDLAELKTYEGQDGYDANKIKEIEREIASNEGDLLKLDQKITRAIEIREAQLANIQKMQSARGKGKEPKVVVTPIQGTSQEQPKKEPQTPKIETQQAATVEEPKKESGDSFWGWVVGVAAVGFAAVVGVNVLKNR